MCVCLRSNTQEEGDEDLLFKMVFVVNMDLGMGVGKVMVKRKHTFCQVSRFCLKLLFLSSEIV